MNSLVWFRVDLRILDNPALCMAIKQASHGKVFACCILSPAEDKRHDRSPHQVDFMLRNLKILSKELYEKFKIPLLVKTATDGKQVHSMLDEIVQKYSIKHLYFNNQYEIDEHRRDLKVEEHMKALGVGIHRYHDQMVVPPFTLKSKSGDVPFTVYSFYKKAWWAYIHEHHEFLDTFDPPTHSQDIDVLPDPVPEVLPGFELSADLKKRLLEQFPAGESTAQENLEQFAMQKLKLYKQNRDIPGIISTSRLSPYLAIGVLSGRQCIRKAMEYNNGHFDKGNEGAVVWVQEVLWREFYKHVLAAFPRISMNRPFKLETEHVAWEYDEVKFTAWKEGKTGYPIVDAAMRELNETGWMHNRMRMVTASFLTKHLLHNWTLGAKYFSQHLIDCDLSSNTSGWLWSASCGNDAQPYFRVFNPLTQAQKFDPDGTYIKRWVPELANLKNAETLHYPQKIFGEAETKKLGYYPRIVDHDIARKKAIAAFENLPKDAVVVKNPKKQRSKY